MRAATAFPQQTADNQSLSTPQSYSAQPQPASEDEDVPPASRLSRFLVRGVFIGFLLLVFGIGVSMMVLPSAPLDLRPGANALTFHRLSPGASPKRRSPATSLHSRSVCVPSSASSAANLTGTRATPHRGKTLV
jgi:hypothetical protein